MSKTGKGENPCCVMRMEDDDDGQKLIECLRGRLLAERQASRTAKEDLELLGKRLMELENRLRKEIKKRDRAEKKLTILKKKLGSLNTSYQLKEQDELFDSSGVSCISSITTIYSNADQSSPVREDSIEKYEKDVKDQVDVRLAFSMDVKDQVDGRLAFSMSSFTTTSNLKREERRLIRHGGVKEIQNSIGEKHVTRANNQYQTLIW